MKTILKNQSRKAFSKTIDMDSMGKV